MAQFAQPTHGFHPPEDLLNQLPFPLTDGIARVTRRPPINGAVHLLRDMRRDRQGAHGRHKASDIKVLVPADGAAGGALASSNRYAASRSALPVAGVTHTLATNP